MEVSVWILFYKTDDFTMDASDHFLELSQRPTAFTAELALSDSSCQQHGKLNQFANFQLYMQSIIYLNIQLLVLVVWIFTSIWLGCN